MLFKTLKTAGLAILAVAAFSLVPAESQAQCARGGYGGFGYGGGVSGFSLSIGNGYGYGGFNRGFSINSFGPSVYRRPVYVPTYPRHPYYGRSPYYGGSNFYRYGHYRF